MELDRRRFCATGLEVGATLSAGGLLLGCQGTRAPAPDDELDRLLAAHAQVLPERAGAGANHYTMAAEALVAMGHPVVASWVEGAAGYAGPMPRSAPIRDRAGVEAALGAYDRFGDLLDFFGTALRDEPWRRVVTRQVPRLAPGFAAAMYHGVIRTGHAVRALRQRDSAARRHELAVGLAYWAARYRELPAGAPLAATGPASVEARLSRLEHPPLDPKREVDFFNVLDPMTETPVAPPFAPAAHAESALDDLVRGAATGFLEMLVQERHRLVLLHTVTGPAAASLILPELERDDARALVGYARQSVVAMFRTYGTPFEPGTHLRAAPGAWTDFVPRAAASGSVHTIKLVEALRRFDRNSDTLCRSVAAQFFEWV